MFETPLLFDFSVVTEEDSRFVTVGDTVDNIILFVGGIVGEDVVGHIVGEDVVGEGVVGRNVICVGDCTDRNNVGEAVGLGVNRLVGGVDVIVNIDIVGTRVGLVLVPETGALEKADQLIGIIVGCIIMAKIGWSYGWSYSWSYGWSYSWISAG